MRFITTSRFSTFCLINLCFLSHVWGQVQSVNFNHESYINDIVTVPVHFIEGNGENAMNINLSGASFIPSYFSTTTNAFQAVPANGIISGINGTSINVIFNQTGIQIPLSDAASNYNFRFRFVYANSEYSELHLNTVVRKPFNMVFALDRSGSMECTDVDDWSGAWPNCIDLNNNNWEKLKDAMGLFMNKIAATTDCVDSQGNPSPNCLTGSSRSLSRLDNDRFAITYFSGSSAPSTFDTPDPTITTFTDFSTFSTGLSGDMSTPPRQEANQPVLGRDGTSIWAGLEKTINSPTGTNTEKVLVFFTDGEQNRSPLIRYDVSSKKLYADIDGSGDKSGSESDLLTDFKIIAIGLNATDGTNNLLHELSTQGVGSYYNVGNGPISNTMNAAIINDAYNDIFHGSSPNNIAADSRRIDDSGEMYFEVNQGVSSLIFDIFFDRPVANLYDYRMHHIEGVDTTDITPILTNQKRGKYSLSAVLNFNHLPVPNRRTSKGRWMLTYKKMRFVDGVRSTRTFTNTEFSDGKQYNKKRRIGSIAYTYGKWVLDSYLENTSGSNSESENVIIIPPDTFPQMKMVVTADDHNLKFDAELEDRDLYVGGELTARVKLKIGNKNISDAKVKAIILKPGDDLGDILARIDEIELDSQMTEEVGGYAAQKRIFLELNEPQKLLAWKTVNGQILDLDFNNSKGAYTVKYRNLDVNGAYKIIYELEYDDPQLGKIIRMKEQSLYVRYGKIKPDPRDRSVNEVLVTSSTPGSLSPGTYTVITDRPSFKSNGQKKYVGPGYDWALSVDPSGTKPDTIIDRGDGSYDLYYKKTGNSSPQGKIYLIDDPLNKNKDLTRFDNPFRWELSLHGGITRPLEQMDSLFNQGYMAEIDLGYYLNEKWMIEGVGGYYNFEPDFNVFGANAYIKYNLGTKGGLNSVWAGVGGGFYLPDAGSWTAGYSGRLSAQRQIGRKLAFTLEAAYYAMQDPDYTFASFGVGFKIQL